MSQNLVEIASEFFYYMKFGIQNNDNKYNYNINVNFYFAMTLCYHAVRIMVYLLISIQIQYSIKQRIWSFSTYVTVYGLCGSFSPGQPGMGAYPVSRYMYSRTLYYAYYIYTSAFHLSSVIDYIFVSFVTL